MATPPPAKKRRQSVQPGVVPTSGIRAAPRRSYTPSRPTFASPTKASLARYNPAVLAQSPQRNIRAVPNPGNAIYDASEDSQSAQAQNRMPQIDLSDSLIDPAVLERGDRAELTAHVTRQVMESFDQALSDVFDGEVPMGIGPQLDIGAQLDQMRDENRQALANRRTDVTGSVRSKPIDNMSAVEEGTQDTDEEPEQGRRGPGSGPDAVVDSVERSESPDSDPSEATKPKTKGRGFKRKSPPARIDSPQVDPTERIALLKELQQVNRQVQSLSQTHDRLAKTPDDEELDSGDILSFLTSIEADDPPSYAELQTPAFTSMLDSFLPYSALVIIRTEPSRELAEYVAPSCKPIEDLHPLPHLQLFTPLRVLHQAGAVSQPSKKRTRTLKQQHSVSISVPGNLLRCRLAYTVITAISAMQNETPSPQIADMKVEDLSIWSKKEIASWTNACVQSQDLTAIGYGLGRYWDVVSRRKAVWQQCHRIYPQFLENSSLSDPNKKPDKSDIIDLLARTSLTFTTQHVQLTLHWNIGLNHLTAEPESTVFVRVAFPDVWLEADSQRESLSKVSTLFDDLMKERGVLGALKVVLPLVLEEPKP